MSCIRTTAAFFLWVACALPQSAALQAYQKGNALFVARRFPEAMEAIDEALRLDPKLVPALTLKAKMAMAESRFEVARASLEKALAVDPKSEYAEFLYGLEAYVTNDLRLALPRFQMARELNPKDPRAALYLGLTCESLGENERALSHYEEAVRLERKAGAPQAGTFLTGARLLLLLGRSTEGERWIAQALQTDPASRDAHFELARRLLGKNDAAAAAKEAETALRLSGGDTTDSQLHYLLMRAYREMENPTESARHSDALKAMKTRQ